MAVAEVVPIIESMSERGLHSIADDLSDDWLEDWAGAGWPRSRRTWRSTRPSSPFSSLRTRSTRPARPLRSLARDRERSSGGPVRASRGGRRPLERLAPSLLPRWECGAHPRRARVLRREYRHAVTPSRSPRLRRGTRRGGGAHVESGTMRPARPTSTRPSAESRLRRRWRDRRRGARALRDRVGAAGDLADEARGPQRWYGFERRRARATSSARRARPGARRARARLERPPTSRPIVAAAERSAELGSSTESSGSPGLGRDERPGHEAVEVDYLWHGLPGPPDPPAVDRHHDRDLHVRPRGSDRRRARDLDECRDPRLVAGARVRAHRDDPDGRHRLRRLAPDRAARRSGGRRPRTWSRCSSRPPVFLAAAIAGKSSFDAGERRDGPYVLTVVGFLLLVSAAGSAAASSSCTACASSTSSTSRRASPRPDPDPGEERGRGRLAPSAPERPRPRLRRGRASARARPSAARRSRPRPGRRP